MNARERIRRIVEKWFLVEPALFGAWTTHALVIEPRTRNIRILHGRIEYNPGFIAGLKALDLEAVLQFEALRILLKHPYGRRKENPVLTYEASNLSIQEYLHSALPIPTARERFGSHEYDRQYLEFYYGLLQRLAELSARGQLTDGHANAGAEEDGGSALPAGQVENGGDGAGDEGPSDAAGADLGDYADSGISGTENCADWAPDELLTDRIDQVIRAARESNQWGSLAGQLREQILATLRPKLDYSAVLRQFRTSVISMERSRTRMRPNRRYGFEYLGSRREYSTRLLVAVDVSGSMSNDVLRHGFSLINRFFDYGVPTIDVIQFDTEITGKVVTLKKARRSIEALGRGGTDFADVIAYIDQHREYDGLIVFTDGYASVPPPPRNRRTRILWLFVSEASYRAVYPGLKHLGKGVFLRPGNPTDPGVA